MRRKPSTCTGTVLIDKREGPPPYEILSVHFSDGSSACTIGDVLARLGITVKPYDRLKITVGSLPPERKNAKCYRRGPREKRSRTRGFSLANQGDRLLPYEFTSTVTDRESKQCKRSILE